MNQLKEMFGDDLEILGFPCNQFGHQENARNEEILACLKHIRPGNGYEPNFHMFQKVEVNGKDAHPLFTEQLPYPSDNPVNLMVDSKLIIWSPVERRDISWNFEKFLIDRQGNPVKRYSRSYRTLDIAKDIEDLL